MQLNLKHTKPHTLLIMISMAFLSGCVVMTTYETRPDITEKAAIRSKCVNQVLQYRCDNKCPNNTEEKLASPEVSSREQYYIEQCMTHYQQNLRKWFSNSSDYPSEGLKEKLKVEGSN